MLELGFTSSGALVRTQYFLLFVNPYLNESLSKGFAFGLRTEWW